MFVVDDEDYLMHIGVPRRSGRYPWGTSGWGSGETTGTQRNKSFLDFIDDLKAEGYSDAEIRKGLDMTVNEYRAQRTIALNARKAARISQAERLRATGMSYQAIADEMGMKGESSVRALLAPGVKDRTDSLTQLANVMKDNVDRKGMVDVGSGVENYVGVSREKMAAALKMLEAEGYHVHNFEMQQLTGDNKTRMKVLTTPDIDTQKKAFLRATETQQIDQLGVYSTDGGNTLFGIKPPVAINPNRIAIRYAEDGGTDADGVVYVRPGVEDIALGGKRYAQVRIAVDGDRYIKGMAVYKDDLPEGVDLLFNTNKTKDTPKMDVLKPMQRLPDGSVDKDNPFGTVIKRQHNAMNIVNEEGDWDTWSKSIAPQVLSKQKPELARRMLQETYDQKLRDLEEISALTNPTIKRKLLESYADDMDSSAVHMKAKAFKDQGSYVILPMNSMKETEIYAPTFADGERVALIRYPHGGTFEIPELTVNNRHAPAKKLLGDVPDAVGINAKVAERLSGADFDGDTVLVIPNRSGALKSTSPLRELSKFEPRIQYREYPGMKVMKNTQTEMGKISNLINDMTIRGASEAEIARAVKHSMVVIDAEKHRLNYQQSRLDQGIKNLEEKYQSAFRESGRPGASTLISRAKSPVYVPETKPRPHKDGGPIDPKTGKLMTVPKGNNKTMKVKALANVDDAHTLSSGTKIEGIYADHSNRMKGLANRARKELVTTPNHKMSSSAKKTYAREVEELDSMLNQVLRRRPQERQAQVMANATYRARVQANRDMTKSEKKKIKTQILNEARNRVGLKPLRVRFTERQWEAIQAGAISESKLRALIDKADLDQVKELATPRTKILMSPSKVNRARSMLAAGRTQAEVASALGVSLTTLKEGLL